MSTELEFSQLSRQRRCRASALILASGALSCASAFGQESPATGDAASDGGLQEVVVTAEKRSGTVQSTPLSITAISGADLQARGLVDLSDVGYATPGVSERNSGPGQTEYEIRGISSSGGESSTTGFYLDDIPLSAPDQALLGKVVIDPSLYDLNRVEILRGPQGTLYGSGSMGGTIKLITNQPDSTQFAASAQLLGSGTQGGGGNYGANAMVNLPLIGNELALRIVGTETYTSGWIDRKVLDPFPLETDGGFGRGDVLGAPVEKTYTDTNWERLQGVRATLQWVPAEGLTITPSAFIQTVAQGAPNYVDGPPGIDSETHYQPFDVREPYSDDFQLFSLPIKYQIKGFDFTSVTSYYHRETHLSQDSSEIAYDFLTALIGVPGLSYADAGALSTLESDHTRQVSEEVRINSNGEGAFQWLVGAFYQDFKPDSTIGTTTPGPIVAELFGAPSYFNLVFNDEIKQYAGFGEASYLLPAHFKLTAGVRYYSYQTEENLVEGGGLVVGPGAPLTYHLPASASGFDPKYNLSYEPSDNLTLYGQMAKGFRPGGGNSPNIPSCPETPLQFQSDDLTSYELGEKARLFGHYLTINGAVYFENWTGIEQTVTPTCGANYVTNAGTAHVYGGELEVDAKLSTSWSITNAGGYTHAYIVSALAGSGFTDGETVQNVPIWTDTTSIVYSLPLPADRLLQLRASNEYTGKMSDVSFNINQVPSRDLINLRAGWIGAHKISVSAFVNNLTDKRAYIGDPAEMFTFVPALNRMVTNQPRTIGLDVNYAWGE